MNNTAKFFWLMKKQSLENELKYQQTLRKLVLNDKDQNEKILDDDVYEFKAAEIAWVLQVIDEKIRSLEEELKNIPNMND